ncbi:MAG: impB/mucB/samB family protein [Alphaproteobacteria bacterium]|nr:impB/mucB/samB family protein [Alphaproteobacteria bacterium]
MVKTSPLFDTPLPPPQELRWLYVDFNSYFASVEQQLSPELRGKPVAVVPVETDSTCAIAASYEAKAFGVKTGTPIYEAKKMCPGLICVLARHEHYVDFHDRIIEEVDRHIPVTDVCSIDEVACSLMKNERSAERVTEIARAIKAGLAANIGPYVRCSIGASSNRYLAKVATDLQKPDGFTILPPAALPVKLYGLQLRDLPGIGANMEKRLNAAGIRTVETLFHYPPKHLRAVWGSIWGEKMWYMLRGYDLKQEETARRSIGHSHVLPPELRPPEKAHDVARRLTMKCAARLRRMDYYARSFHLSVRLDDGPRYALDGKCEPAQDSFVFLKMMDEMWARLMQEVKNKRVKKISVTVEGLTPAADLNAQPDLFAPAPQETKTRGRNEKISKAMDKLNHKFGRDTVLVGMTPAQGKTLPGTKIAFTRIPDAEEFLE